MQSVLDIPQYLTEFIDNNRLLTELWLMSSFCGLKKTRFKTASYDCGQKHDCCFFFVTFYDMVRT